MNDKETIYLTLIDAWRRGILSAAETADFERLRKEDPEFNTYCILTQHLTAQSMQEKIAQSKAMFQRIEQKLEAEHFFEPLAIKRSLWTGVRPLMAYAAALTVLLAAIFFWPKDETAVRALANQAIDNTALPINVSDGQGLMPTVDNKKIKEAYVRAASGQFNEAAKIWQALYDADEKPGDVQVRFNLAVCRLKHKDSAAALELLKDLDASDEDRKGTFIKPLSVTDLRWYLALAYAAEGQPKEAEKILRGLAPIHPEAARLLSELEKL